MTYFMTNEQAWAIGTLAIIFAWGFCLLLFGAVVSYLMTVFDFEFDRHVHKNDEQSLVSARLTPHLDLSLIPTKDRRQH